MQVSTRTGIEHEETLLYESAARESSLNTQVLNMEIDLKNAKIEVRRLQTEKERLEQVPITALICIYIIMSIIVSFAYNMLYLKNLFSNIPGLCRSCRNKGRYPFRN